MTMRRFYLIVFTVLTLAVGSRAQEKENQRAEIKPPTKLRLSLVIVPELQACKPNGYAPSGQRSACKPLTNADVQSWINRNRYPHSQVVIPLAKSEDDPPYEVVLTEAELELLSNYYDANKSTPAKRKAMVIMFDFGQSIPSGLTMMRTSSEEVEADYPRGGNRAIEKNMRGRNHYIYHERADDFLPAYNMTWTLSIHNGNLRWVFRTASR
jgi:hypothetical protein